MPMPFLTAVRSLPGSVRESGLSRCASAHREEPLGVSEQVCGVMGREADVRRDGSWTQEKRVKGQVVRVKSIELT